MDRATVELCSSNCCLDRGSLVGCEDQACQEQVCEIVDPFCCMIGWDLEGDPYYDVAISLDSYNVYGEYGAEFNGWQLIFIPEPSSLILTSITALLICGQRWRR